MNTYIVKTGNSDREVLCHYSGYAMLPAEIYLLTKKQAEWIVELASHIGLNFTLAPYSKKYHKFDKFRLKGCDTPWDHFSDEEFIAGEVLE